MIYDLTFILFSHLEDGNMTISPEWLVMLNDQGGFVLG